jgi:uncharacterized SAM-binding protein YcdF (DUF218 family)
VRTEQRTRLTVGRLVLLLVLTLTAYGTVTAAQVWWAANRDDASPADAIVVLGAAQYDGKPSLALQGRLDHATRLYEDGMAPLIVVTGGRKDGDRFTEAAAGAAYLERSGIPGSAIERETHGASSYASLSATARFLHQAGVTDVLLVSDPFHNYRIQAIADEVGLDARASASTTSPFSGSSELRQMARETAAVALGRLVGYRRVEAFGLRLEQLRQ